MSFNTKRAGMLAAIAVPVLAQVAGAAPDPEGPELPESPVPDEVVLCDPSRATISGDDPGDEIRGCEDEAG